MATIELMEYEVGYLLVNLRDAMHMHERMSDCDDETLRYHHAVMAHQCKRLLEAIQPKHCGRSWESVDTATRLM